MSDCRSPSPRLGQRECSVASREGPVTDTLSLDYRIQFDDSNKPARTSHAHLRRASDSVAADVGHFRLDHHGHMPRTRTMGELRTYPHTALR